MSSVIIECWNCGQKLRVNTDNLETARCGNCQQMIARQEQPAVRGFRAPKEKRKVGQLRNFFLRMLGGALGLALGIVLGLGLLVIVFFMFYAATGLVGSTFSVLVALWLMAHFGESVINEIVKLFGWTSKQWRESKEDTENW